jgi:hypothetical protein
MNYLNFLLPLMALCGGNICNSQYVITKENNLIRGGDLIVKQQVVYVNPGKPGENKIWDFSGITTMNEKYKVSYRSYNDTVITGTEHRTIYKYALKSDTLYMTGHENPLTLLSDSIPQVFLSFPFAYCSKIDKDFLFNGKYSEVSSLISIGHTTIVADAYGTITLPDADTLNNVIRVRTLNDSRIRIYDPKTTVNSVVNFVDSLAVDTLTRHREEIYRWYAEGYRYPVFETVTHTYYKNDKPLSHFNTAFYYPPREQQFEVEDSINSMIRERLIKNNDNDFSNSIRNWDKDNNRNNAGITEKTTEEFDSSNGEFTVSTKTGNVTVEYNLSVNSEIEIILTDLHGRVCGYVPLHMQVTGSYAETITRNNLNPGDYILSFIVNGEVSSYKFSML